MDHIGSYQFEPGRLYTSADARKMLGIGEWAWRNLVNRGLVVRKQGRRTYVFGDDILTFFRDASPAAQNQGGQNVA